MFEGFDLVRFPDLLWEVHVHVHVLWEVHGSRGTSGRQMMIAAERAMSMGDVSRQTSTDCVENNENGFPRRIVISQ